MLRPVIDVRFNPWPEYRNSTTALSDKGSPVQPSSGLLGFWQEHSATSAAEKLLAMVKIKASVLRDGKPSEFPVDEIVPEDIAILNAGDVVPGVTA